MAGDGHVDVRVAKFDIGMVVGLVGEGADAGDQLDPRVEAAGGEPGPQRLEQLAPVAEAGGLHLGEGQDARLVGSGSHDPTLPHPVVPLSSPASSSRTACSPRSSSSYD